MKPYSIFFGTRIRTTAVLGLALSLLFLTSLVFSQQAVPTSMAQDGAFEAFLPVLLVPVSTPQFVKNVPLPTAKCPNAAGFNHVSGYMYIINSFSNNVSVFRDRAFVIDIATGEWPSSVASDPQSDRTWVTNLHSGVSLLQGTAQTGFVPRSYEPYGVAFNPVNGYVYVTDLDSKVQIINGSQEVTTLSITDPQTGNGAGWMRPIVVDPRTGLVYAASWDYGRLYVIEGTNVTDSVRLGWGPLNMALDSVRRLIYVAHSDPNAAYPHDISVVDLDTLTVTYVDPEPGEINTSRDVAVDPRTGLAYVTNPDRNTVTVLDGTAVVGKVPVGERPWGIGVNPNNGYVFVTNRNSNDVSILRNGMLQDVVEIHGQSPFAVGVDTINKDIYIVNRGEEYGLFRCRNGSVSILH